MTRAAAVLPSGTSFFWRKSKRRWVLNYLTALGWRQKVLGPEYEYAMRHEAAAWAAQWLVSKSIDPGATLQKRSDLGPPVSEFVRQWLSIREGDDSVAPATLKNNIGHLDAYILPTFGDVPLAALQDRRQQIREWLVALRSQKSISHTRNVFFTFKAFYRDAMMLEWIDVEDSVFDHPAVLAALPKLDDREDPEQDPTEVPLDWVQRLLDAHDTVPLERRVRYVLGFTTGTRDGELAGLKWGDLDVEASPPRVRIVRAAAIVGAKGKGAWAKLRRPKTKKSVRILPLHPAAVDALAEWAAVAWSDHHKPPSEHFIFPGARPDRARRPRSAALIRHDLTSADLPTEVHGQAIQFKATRSTFGSWLEAAGVAETTRKRLLGHVLIDVTQRHYTARDLDKLAAAVSRIALVWRCSVTLPPVVPGGTRPGSDHARIGATCEGLSSEPPSGFEPETYGLRKGAPIGRNSANGDQDGFNEAPEGPLDSSLRVRNSSLDGPSGRLGTTSGHEAAQSVGDVHRGTLALAKCAVSALSESWDALERHVLVEGEERWYIDTRRARFRRAAHRWLRRGAA